MNKYLIVGNWKMNPNTEEETKKISARIKRTAPELKQVEVVIAPPAIYLKTCRPVRPIANIHLGSQDVSDIGEGGPHTGEVNASMLKDLGVSYVIVGHSERRKRGETGTSISKKVLNVLEAGLTPIVCVGELERDTDGNYMEGLKTQIKESLTDIPKKYAKDIIIAYEPVWAIGAKEPMASNDIHEMSIFVKKVFADVFTPDAGIKTTVLYGGAVNFRNAVDIINTGKVDGFLVGRESVNVTGFIELLKVVDSIK